MIGLFKAPWSLLIIIACWALPAHAHKQQVSTTHLKFNSVTGNLEIMHRFHTHDAEHYLNHLLKKHGDLLLNPEHQRVLGHYVADSFTLATQRGKAPLALTYVGQEIEGPHFWVYQEVAAKQAKALWVEVNFFQDLWPKYSTELYNQSGILSKRYMFDSQNNNQEIPLDG